MSVDQGEMFEVTEAKAPSSMSRESSFPAGDSYVPAPPTGPAAEVYSREAGKPPALIKFMESDDGPPFWLALEEAALAALGRRERRFSARGFLAHWRDTKRVRINNDFSPWFADRLVAKHPQLIDIIERRVRKKPGPRS